MNYFPDVMAEYVEKIMRAEYEFRTRCEQRLLAAGFDPATTALDIVTETTFVDGADPFTEGVGWAREIRVTMTPRVTVLPQNPATP
jgi:hypothetical protein